MKPKPTKGVDVARVLVTGATSFLGWNVVMELVKRGFWVRAADLPEADWSVYPVSKFQKVIYTDGATVEQLRGLVEGVGYVFHFHESPWLAGVPLHKARNVDYTFNLLSACRVGRPKFIFASTSEVYSPRRPDMVKLPRVEFDRLAPVSWFGITKLMAEQWVQQWTGFGVAGLSPVTLRYFCLYGPGQKTGVVPTMITQIQSRLPVAIDAANPSADYVYIQDAVDASIAAMKGPPGAIVNVGSGKQYTDRTVVQKLAKLLGTTVAVAIPAAGNAVQYGAASLTFAAKALKYHPKVSIDEGLAATVSEWMSRPLERIHASG